MQPDVTTGNGADWSFRDDVRPLDLGAYERAMDGLLGALRGRAGIVAVYQLGSVRFPGISDLDVIIVVNDEIPPGTDFRSIVHDAAGPDGRYIFSHAPYVIHERGFPHLPSLFFADNLQHRLGRDIALAPTPADEAAFHRFQIAVEAAIAQSFAFLRSLHSRAVPNLRSLLCHLNAVRHNFSTLARWSDASQAPAHWAAYTARIDALRGGWFTLPQAERTAQAAVLMEDARGILLEILGRLAAVGQERGYLADAPYRAWLSLLDINVLLQFAPVATAASDRLANPLGSLRELAAIGPWLRMQPRWRELANDVSVLTLPSTLYPLINAWPAGPLGDVLAARSLGMTPGQAAAPPAVVRDWLAHRGAWLNDYLAFVAQRQLTGLLLLSPASWLQLPQSLPNRLKTHWNRLWVERQLGR